MHGHISWHELMAPDLDQAKAFYSGAFGWSFQPFGPMGDGYVIARIGEAMVGGMMQTTPEMQASPHWLMYVEVDDVDRAIKKAEKLGGRAKIPAFDVSGLGRIGIMQDHTGAAFGIMTPETDGGPPDMTPPGPGEFCWRTLMTPDVEGSLDFYAQLFGWGVSQLDLEDGATFPTLSFEGLPVASVTALAADYPAPPHWGLAIAIEDTKNTVAKVTDFGGNHLAHRTTVKAIGTHSLLKDSVGAVVSLFEANPAALPGRSQAHQAQSQSNR